MFCHLKPGLDHPNVLSYVDVLRQDVNVGNRLAIIGAGGVGFDAKRWMEYWGVEGTNKARAVAAAAVPSQSFRGQRQRRQRGGGGGCIVRVQKRLEMWATWERRRYGFTRRSWSRAVG